MDPIAATFRVALELSDMEMIEELKIFSVYGIADVPTSDTKPW